MSEEEKNDEQYVINITTEQMELNLKKRKFFDNQLQSAEHEKIESENQLLPTNQITRQPNRTNNRTENQVNNHEPKR